MKRFLLTLLTLALVAALIALALMPTATRQYRLSQNAKVTSGYQDAVRGLSLLDCDTLLAQAEAYNQALGSTGWVDPFSPASGDSGDGEAYAALLNPAGNGVMAVLEVPKLGISQAVYHGGASDSPTARVSHVPRSQLPAKGAPGPCLLSATRERFYDPLAGLGRLMEGDCFFLHVLQETWTYEVFQVAVVAPEALAEFQATEDDECALVVATTEKGREARLVARGRRVPRRSAKPVDDSRPLPNGVPELIFAAPVAAVGLALLAVVEWVRRSVRRHKRRRMKL